MTLVSLGCVTALFVNHVSTSYSGTIPMMVTFIPLLVHILLVRDIYVKWEDRWVGRTQHCNNQADTNRLKPGRHQQVTTRQTPADSLNDCSMMELTHPQVRHSVNVEVLCGVLLVEPHRFTPTSMHEVFEVHVVEFKHA